MNSTTYILKTLREDITQNSLQLRAIIQDICACAGPMNALYDLNGAGRSKIATLRRLIEKFGDIAKENDDNVLLKEVISQRDQLSKSMQDFKSANVNSMLAIEKRRKEELMTYSGDDKDVRQRKKRDKDSLVKMSSNVTDQLLAISRQLAETTKRSAETLDTLVVSSDNVTGTQEELKNTSGIISQSGKLLNKYGRREFTDKILITFAFAFFLLCVLYIVQKRLF